MNELYCIHCNNSIFSGFDKWENEYGPMCNECIEKMRFKNKLKSLRFGTVPGGYKSTN
jgi:hypothetical protein